ncbi:MAG: FAD-dependent oxidoreductase [Pseudomonadota bacterium]
MKPNGHYDCLIVGMGLAGGLLAWRLRQTGQKILIADPCSGRSASRTAAGLINPVTGRRLVKTKNFERMLASAQDLYRTLEDESGLVFYRPLQLLRLFASEQQAALWRERKKDSRHDPCFQKYVPPDCCPAGTNAPFGGFLVPNAATVDTEPLLDWLERLFDVEGVLAVTTVAPDEIKPTSNGIRWRRVTAQRVILCQGYHSADNTWFDWLPFQPAKGEILTLSSQKKLTTRALAKEKWLIPTRTGYRLGATYQWRSLDDRPSQSGRRLLLEALNTDLLTNPAQVEIIAHKAGIRPGTRDKQPFIGFHPDHPRIALFNGFGSKGALTIPWYSDAFTKSLTDGIPIPPEADVGRFCETHFPG